MFFVYLSCDNSKTIRDIKFKFSAVLVRVKATIYLKFQSTSAMITELAFSSDKAY